MKRVTHFSWKIAFKQALSNSKHTAVRTLLAVLLAAIALSLLGCALVTYSFDPVKTGAFSLHKSAEEALLLVRRYVYREERAGDWLEGNVSIQEIYEDLPFTAREKESMQAFIGQRLFLSDGDRYEQLACGVGQGGEATPGAHSESKIFYLQAEEDFLNVFSYTLQGTLPRGAEEIVLPRCAANAAVEFGFFDPSGRLVRVQDAAELIGQSVQIGEKGYAVCGILSPKTPCEAKAKETFALCHCALVHEEWFVQNRDSEYMAAVTAKPAAYASLEALCERCFQT